MLLEELINLQTVRRNVGKKLKNNEHSNDRNRLGHGYYSNVYKNKDPHLVTKVSRIPSRKIEDNDPYWFFIRRLTETKINERNPYFPRVYSIKRYSDSDPESETNINEIRNAQIEKLEELDQLTEDEIYTIFQKIRNEKEVDYLRGYPYDQSKLIHFIPDTIKEDLSSSYLLNDVEDFNYKEAILFLRKLKKENNRISFDIHKGNLMVRRTPYGVQLVITDPFG